jgi:hypothetical protein
MLNKNQNNNNYNELFSTDSEMDSFFRENESIVNKAYKLNNDNLSSSTSPNKTDDNTIDNIDDDEFDRIVSEAQRYFLTLKLFIDLISILIFFIIILDLPKEHELNLQEKLNRKGII